MNPLSDVAEEHRPRIWGITEEELAVAREALKVPPSRDNPRCDGDWHVWVDEKGYERAERCKCRGQDPWAVKLKAQVNRLGHCYTWEGFDQSRQPHASQVVAHIMRTWEAGLYLEGASRTGKTHAAKALVYEATRQHKTSDFIHVAYLSRLFSQSQGMDDRATQAEDDLKKLAGLDLIVIDDLGCQRDNPSGVFIEQFPIWLESLRGLLVITTNLSPVSAKKGIPSDLESHYGERIARRIAERCARVEFLESGRAKDSTRKRVEESMAAAERMGNRET